MSPAQEAKLDEVFKICLRTEGKLNVVDEKLKQHKEAIIDQEEELGVHRTAIQSLDADRNKAKGAIRLGISSAAAGVLAFLSSFFKH